MPTNIKCDFYKIALRAAKNIRLWTVNKQGYHLSTNTVFIVSEFWKVYELFRKNQNAQNSPLSHSITSVHISIMFK